MNVWLCPVKPRSWRIIKQRKVFGVPYSGQKKLNEVNIGDLLVFYVFKPVNGIVAIYRIVSNPYKGNEDIWGRSRYPYRVRIEPIPDFMKKERKPIPLCLLFGTFNNKRGIVVEPYLRGVLLAKIHDRQFQRLKDLFRRDS